MAITTLIVTVSITIPERNVGDFKQSVKGISHLGHALPYLIPQPVMRTCDLLSIRVKTASAIPSVVL